MTRLRFSLYNTLSRLVAFSFVILFLPHHKGKINLSILEIAGLAATGFLAGIFGTIVGIGGGIVFVPVFLLIFHFTPQQATGTSLFAIFFNVLSGSISYLRQKRVDIKAGWKFALATIPGAFLGAWLANFLTSNILQIIFGLLLIIVAALSFIRAEPKSIMPKEGEMRRIEDIHGHTFLYRPREGLGVFLSLLIGIISSLIGIGGGIIHVPAMIYLLGFPVHIATATSQFVLVISTFFGSIGHITLGDTLIIPGLIVGIAAIPGAILGAELSRRLKGLLIIRLLAIALITLGIRLLLKAFDIL